MKLLPSTAGLIGLLVFCLARGPAVAATGPSVVVLPVGLDNPSKTQEAWLTEGAEKAIVAAGRFTLVPLGNVGSPAQEAMGAKAVEAETSMQAGQKSLD